MASDDTTTNARGSIMPERFNSTSAPRFVNSSPPRVTSPHSVSEDAARNHDGRFHYECEWGHRSVSSSPTMDRCTAEFSWGVCGAEIDVRIVPYNALRVSARAVTEEEVEAAARAIYESDEFEDTREMSWDEEPSKDWYIGVARAALKAAARIRTDRETA